MKRILLILMPQLLLLAANNAFAAKEVAIEDGGTAQVTVSQRELTRIALAGKGRLVRVWGVEGQFTVQADDESGEAFIRPVEGMPAGKAFSFFVKDDTGGTYTLLATVADVPAQTVFLRTNGVSPGRKSLNTANAGGGSEPYVQGIKLLVRGMLAAESAGVVEGCTREDVNQPLPIWQETSIQISQRWRCESLTGEVLLLRNVSASTMRLDEHEFEGLYPDVKAVSIPTQVLEPQQATAILLVRKARQ